MISIFRVKTRSFTTIISIFTLVLLGYTAHTAFGEDFPVIFTMNEPYTQTTGQTQSSLSTMIN
ncbi:MAG: hypothetical protein R3321_04305, partial [Nitrososphaeraceae archaeon]|nr:hypothetical protein [Nitrososphaeraceae archaeon]